MLFAVVCAPALFEVRGKICLGDVTDASARGVYIHWVV